MTPNGFRPQSAPPQIKIQSMSAAVMVYCVCNKPILLPFVPGMPLQTSCTCKRKLSVGAITVDNVAGTLQVAVGITEATIIQPELDEIVKLG